ncbi:MAG: hypothetical protein ABI655_11515 [Phenylobacterium sp.]
MKRQDIPTLMTAQQCRARATELIAMAEASPGDALNPERAAMALEWRKLAALAEWQDALLDSLDDGRRDARSGRRWRPSRRTPP